MGDTTGISWADSTYNPWIGCTKVGPGCDHCYAVDVASRSGVTWGAGAPRRRTADHTRHALRRYQRKAAAFVAEHGHRQRVFTSSLADVFDNEVAPLWRTEAFEEMEAAPDVLVMICTKRVSNIAKMVPATWRGPTPISKWPRNVGVLITTVTPEEVRRDLPRLIELKKAFGIPWIGLSIEPMIEDVHDALDDVLSRYPEGTLDWAIFGGESGHGARECQVEWITDGVRLCDHYGVAAFVKQLGSKPISNGLPWTNTSADPSGKVHLRWPASVPREFAFPAALDGGR